MPEIRIFVGTSADGSDCESQAVMEYTLRSRCSQAIELTWLKAAPQGDFAGWNTLPWGTPFSGFRWIVPHLCGYQGRAIYLDSDVIVLGDIAELWNQAIPEDKFALVAPNGRTCVMLLDCLVAARYLPSLKNLKHAGGFNLQPAWSAPFEGLWNCVDLKGYKEITSDIKLIHYSSIAHQPSTPHAVRRLGPRRHWYNGERFTHWRPELVALFNQELKAARAAGYTPESYEPEKPFKPTILSYRNKRVKGYSTW